MNPKVDLYIRKSKTWRDVMETLRPVLLGLGLSEELKWGKAAYVYNGANIVVMVAFKNYCSLIFAKGALLKDPKGLLVKPGENTQAARQMRFTSAEQAAKLAPVAKAYVTEAIANEKAGRDVVYKPITAQAVPEEFAKALAANLKLKKAFEALTPGRRRAYLMYFAAAKQSKTREARIAKCTKPILTGKGLNE